MRKPLHKNGLSRSDFLSYGGAAFAVSFILAMTFGVFDGPDTTRGIAAGSPTLIAESSP